MQKLTEKSNLIVDSFAWMPSVRKAYILLSIYRRIVGCKMNFSYLTTEKPQLILIYTLQALKRESVLNTDVNSSKFANVYVE